MVQSQAGPSTAPLKADDYLIPLATLRDALLSPSSPGLPVPRLRQLLSYHLDVLKRPWQPFGPPQGSSKASLESSSITIPRTKTTLAVDTDSRKVALKLADKIKVDEVSCFLLFRSYQSYALDRVDADRALREGKDAEVYDQVVRWYMEECVAAVQIVLAALSAPEPDEDNEDVVEVATGVRDEVLQDVPAFIEGLFRAFGGLAQRRLEGYQRSHLGLEWATHQLRLQDAILQLLFAVLYQNPSRPALVSEALVRGSILSAFGTQQANTEFWENSSECARLEIRIRDLLILITCESLCLGSALSDETDKDVEASLIGDKNRLASLNDFVQSQSLDLDIQGATLDGQEALRASDWPIAVVCLAWAIVLRETPENLRPTGDDEDACFIMTRRALAGTSGLFDWLERLLSGPLLEPKREDVGGGILSNLLVTRKKVIKDLLIGLSQLVQLDYVPDRPALYRVWEKLFGGADPSSSLALGTDYWNYDFDYPPRRAILDESRFPLQPTHLLRVLSSLAGPISSEDATTCETCCRYFSRLPRLTFVTRPDAYRIITRQSDGRRLVETSRPIVLPGGLILPANTSGVVISREDDPQDVVTYALQDRRLGGWAILGVLLREASGLPVSPDELPLVLSYENYPLYLSVADLGISVDADEILATGLKFCLAVLRPTSPITLDILTAISPDRSRPAVHVITDLLVHVLRNSTNDTSETRLTIVERAIDLLSVLLRLPTGEAWSHLRATGFFLVSSSVNKKNTATRLFASDVTRGEYGPTLAILRLVLAMVGRAVNLPTPDAVLLRSALHTVFVEVWSVFQVWRYRDVGQKWEIASVLLDIFDTAMRHPSAADNASTPAVDLLSNVFITSTSLATYRPLVEVITQFEQIVRRLMGMRRTAEVQTVIVAFENALSFLATLLRLSEKTVTGVSPARSVLGLTVTSSKGQKLQLIDLLLEIACAPSTPESASLEILKTFRTFFATSSTTDELSLTSSLRNAQRSFDDVATLASNPSPTLQASAWRVLAAATATQSGSSTFTIGSTADKPLGSILSIACTILQDWEDLFSSSPSVLSACVTYCQSIISASPSSPAVAKLRKEAAFWQAVYDISRRHVPPPPTVLLSAKSSDFIPRVEEYCYRMSARAEAASLLAAELGAILDADEDPRDSNAHDHVLSLFRNKAQLQETSLLAIHSSCDPSVHEAQRRNLSAADVPLPAIRQLRLPGEAEYGGSYLYDPEVAVYGQGQTQSLVNLAIDLLNTSWSVLDADIALTRAFRSLAEQVSAWTDGDALAQAAAAQAGLAVAEVLSDETRGGDVMLAIQHERLCVLAILLETATSEDATIEPSQLARYATAVRSILESQTFPPILSMRQPELPPLHRPILRILNALAPSFAAAETDEGLFEPVFSFVAEAADIVLDAVIRNQPSPFLDDLGLVVGIICELSKVAPTSTIWLDKLGEYDLIGRSLQVIVNARLVPTTSSSHADSSKSAVPETGTITPAVSAVLLLHLALSSVPASAEKLAISGLLSAYSDNALVALAESSLLSPASSPSAHDAWCSMLQVVRSLLCTLPDTATYVRTDVIPWIRVCIPQMLKAMAWDPQETSGTSRAELDELELTCDLFLSISAAIGPGSAGAGGLLVDWAVPALELLANIQWALSHPNLFASSILPVDEEEREALIKELEPLDSADPQNQVKLGDWDRNLVVCSRMAYLARITRGVVLALINFTSAWGTLKGREVAEQTVLTIGQPKIAAHDPVGIILDLHAQLSSLSDALSASSKPEAKAAREATYQTTEAMAVLCTAQLVTRHLLLPNPSGEHGGRSTDGDGSMEVDQVGPRSSHGDERKRRGSALDTAGDEDESGLLGQLTSDLYGILSEEGGGVLGWLRGVAGAVMPVNVEE